MVLALALSVLAPLHLLASEAERNAWWDFLGCKMAVAMRAISHCMYVSILMGGFALCRCRS
eukprot:4672051-Pyramimonas_sp.AAC.1